MFDNRGVHKILFSRLKSKSFLLILLHNVVNNQLSIVFILWIKFCKFMIFEWWVVFPYRVNFSVPTKLWLQWISVISFILHKHPKYQMLIDILDSLRLPFAKDFQSYKELFLMMNLYHNEFLPNTGFFSLSNFLCRFEELRVGFSLFWNLFKVNVNLKPSNLLFFSLVYSVLSSFCWRFYYFFCLLWFFISFRLFTSGFS